MPTLTATPLPSESRVHLDVAHASVTDVTIVRVEIDGNRVTVRNANPAEVVTGVWSGDDFEAPMDSPVYYEMTSSTDATVYSSSLVTLDSQGRVWLKNVGTPSLNMAVTLKEKPQPKYSVRRGVFSIIGRTNPIVSTDIRGGVEADVSLKVSTYGEASALRALVEDGSPVYLQFPSIAGAEDVYLSLGDVSVEPLTRLLTEERSVWSFPAIQIDSPVGVSGGAAGITYASLLTKYATYADMLTVTEPSPIWVLSTARKTTAIVAAYSGVDLVSPVDLAGYAVRSGSATTVAAPSITTTGSNRRVLGVFGDKSTTSASITDPASVTRRDAKFGSGAGATSGLLVDFTQLLAGATAVKTATWDVASPDAFGAQIALKPSGGSAPAFRSVSDVSNDGTSDTTTCALPSGVLTDDWMIAIFVSADTVAGSPITSAPTGWTVLRAHTNMTGGSYAIYYKFRVGRTYADILNGI